MSPAPTLPKSPRSPTVSERTYILEQWVADHDKLCADRYGELKESLTWLVRGAFGIVLAIIAWMAVQLWQGAERRLEVADRAASAAPLASSPAAGHP